MNYCREGRKDGGSKRLSLNEVCDMRGSIEPSKRLMRQRIIVDTDFCGKCFKEIMNSESEDLVNLDTLCLPQMVVK